MGSLQKQRGSATRTNSSPSCLRFGSFGVLLVSIGLLSVSFALDIYGSRLAAGLVPTISIALTCAVCLAVYSSWYFLNEHRRTEKAFRDTDCEFSSIFQNVLDGILILNQTGECLDANPAAIHILRIPSRELIGQHLRGLFPESKEFDLLWDSFLDGGYKRGQVNLVAGDGTFLVVDFTAAANYLPGRHVFILCDATERTRTEACLRESEERFQHMASNIQELFWMMDASTQEVTYVNHAYATLTGHSIESLRTNPISYRELIYPEDRIRVLSKLQEVISTGVFDEEFRFIRADGAVRWVWAKGFPVRADGATRWLVGTAQDITSRKQAEKQISEHLDDAEAARAEAEALRKSTLALSQNLAMDSVLDTLLQCISELIPFDVATVLFVEDGSNLMVAREAPRVALRRVGLSFNASEIVFLEKILFEQKAMILRDVTQEKEWRDVPPLDRIKSWLGVPLIAAGSVLGILSLGAHDPDIFASEHLRLAKSLALAAAVAINNARVHERAEIYAAELELNLRELRETQKALQQAEQKFSRPTHF
jgi:PAS domain S-box-containing protein